MKQVILIHGLPDKNEVLEDIWPSPSNSHWFPWVQKQLTRKDVLCQTPEMPKAYNPNYQDHKKVLDQFDITEETILVGHSCGGGFLLKYFSENKTLKPKKIILVAPWLDPDKYLKKLNPSSDYFDFKFDLDLPARTSIDCMYSTDDDDYIIKSVEIIKKELPSINYISFADKGHFTEPDLGTKEFPELMNYILN